MNVRTILAVIGSVSIVAAAVLLIAPDLAGYLAVDSILIGIIGASMVVLGLIRLQRRRTTSLDFEETGTPEIVVSVATPGDEYDTMLDSYERPPQEYRGMLDELSNRVRQLAEELVIRERACSHEEAAQIVEDGSWTDDRIAQSYFSTDADHSAALNWRERIRRQIHPDIVHRDRLARTMEAVAENAGIDYEEDDA